MRRANPFTPGSGASSPCSTRNAPAPLVEMICESRYNVSFGSRGVFAFDFEGKLLWQRDLGRISNYHGAAGSPLLYKDRLVLYQDQGRDSFIAAFDAQSGRPLWRTSRDANVGWGSPIVWGDHIFVTAAIGFTRHPREKVNSTSRDSSRPVPLPEGI